MKISVPLRVALALIITNKTHAFSAPPISLTGRFPYSSTKTVAICMTGDKSAEGQRQKKRQKLRDALGRLTNVIAKRPIAAVAPQAIAEIITDAIKSPLDLALEEVGQVGGMRQSLAYYDIIEKEAAIEGDTARALDTIALAKTTAADAFALAESAIEETEEALTKSKLALAQCREDVAKAIANAEKSAYQANVASQKATVLAASVVISASGTSVQDPKKTEVATNISTELEGDKPETIIEKASSEPAKEVSFDVSALTYEDVDYHMSEMQPPFIGEDQCLVPGEAVVRVEKATDNSRRIFAGIDIMASVDDVWNVSFKV